jgi:hypothetical protein
MNSISSKRSYQDIQIRRQNKRPFYVVNDRYIQILGLTFHCNEFTHLWISEYIET